MIVTTSKEVITEVDYEVKFQVETMYPENGVIKFEVYGFAVNALQEAITNLENAKTGSAKSKNWKIVCYPTEVGK